MMIATSDKAQNEIRFSNRFLIFNYIIDFNKIGVTK